MAAEAQRALPLELAEFGIGCIPRTVKFFYGNITEWGAAAEECVRTQYNRPAGAQEEAAAVPAWAARAGATVSMAEQGVPEACSELTGIIDDAMRQLARR